VQGLAVEVDVAPAPVGLPCTADWARNAKYCGGVGRGTCQQRALWAGHRDRRRGVKSVTAQRGRACGSLDPANRSSASAPPVTPQNGAGALRAALPSGPTVARATVGERPGAGGDRVVDPVACRVRFHVRFGAGSTRWFWRCGAVLPLFWWCRGLVVGPSD
jgi:hypothetical protein